MANLATLSTRQSSVLRWTARVIGTLFVGFFLALFIPEWVQKGAFPATSDRLLMTIVLFMAFAGLLVAWKWEGIGGIVALASIIVFTALGLRTDAKPGGIMLVCAMYALPAALFLLSWHTRRHATPG
jgi:hypothetical protein